MRLLPLPGVFQPPSDAFMLAEVLREEIVPGSRVLDLCTGSGVLALTAAQCGASEVVAVDISRRAMLSVRVNALLNGAAVGAVRGDLLEAVRGRRFDLIVSNPPYLPGDVDSLPRHGVARAWEGGRDGRAFVDRICREVAVHLTARGVLLLVHSSVCGERQTLQSLSAHGLEARVALRRLGPLGPRLRRRADWLRGRGLLYERDEEEILVIRAQRASRAHRPTTKGSSQSGAGVPKRGHEFLMTMPSRM